MLGHEDHVVSLIDILRDISTSGEYTDAELVEDVRWRFLHQLAGAIVEEVDFGSALLSIFHFLPDDLLFFVHLFSLVLVHQVLAILDARHKPIHLIVIDDVFV